jgi:hypothetical protein
VNSVKFAFYNALSAAKAHFLVERNGAAAQTTLGFLLHLFLCEGETGVIKGVRLAFIMTCRLTWSVIIAADNNVLLIKRMVFSSVSSKRKALPGPYGTVNGDCGLLARGNCVDSEFRTGKNVASDKNVFSFV